MRNTRLGNVFLARVLAGTAIAAGMSAGFAAPVHAQSGQVSLDVQAGPLSTALNEFASQTGYQLLYPSDLVAGKTSGGASGSMSVGDGLSRVLGGTGLRFTLLDGRTIQISAANAGADGELVTGVVSVEGYQGSPYFGGAGVTAGVNGINGSRDITATEGTGSFTSGALTIGSKVPQALKDVPQSISVLTSERMEQQNVTDFNDALKQMSGITAVQGGTSLETTFYSRGFQISDIQVDGGAPITATLMTGNPTGYYPQIDMAQYDHVELLRGAAGQFNGYGNPGGTVNLVRKKPLDHTQFIAEVQAGSWNNYRAMLDASAPLAFDGKLRGRVVAVYQDNQHFYEIAEDNKTLLYGVLEFDASPTTLISAGVSQTRQDSVPWQNGLPLYRTGADIGLPRSTCFCFDWNSWDFETTEIFGGVEQKIGEDWTAKLNLTRNSQSSRRKMAYSTGAVNPLSGTGPYLTGNFADYDSEQFSADFNIAGAFELFGQRQEVTAGISRVNTDGSGTTTYDYLISTYPTPYQPYPGGPSYCYDYGMGTCPVGTIPLMGPPVDVFDFDPSDPNFTEPGSPLPNTRYPTDGQIETVAYLNLRLTAFDRLHLTTGLRWSKHESKNITESLCTSIPDTGTPNDPYSCFGREIGDAYYPFELYYSDTDFSWPPAVNLSYDLTDRLTAYAGYTDIYISQAFYLDSDLKPLKPITGSNWEGGLKWSGRDGKLNVSIAGYRIKQEGFNTLDGEWDFNVTPEDVANGIWGYWVAGNGRRVPNGKPDPDHQCCYVSNPDQKFKSIGVDFEIAGELRRGWQFSASYNYNESTYDGAYWGSSEGQPTISLQPKHLYKIWTSFDFGAAGKTGPLAGLTLSLGINGQSAGYNTGSICTALTPPDQYGNSQCQPGASEEYDFVVPPYAVVSSRIDYRFSDKWSLAVNLENLFDKTYYQKTGSPSGGNWYGAPRSVTATLRAKW